MGAEVDEERASALPALAWQPISVVASLMGTVMLIFSSRLGYFGDELYFIGAGSRPDVNFADQPPLVPWLAHVMNDLGGGSLVVLRLPSVLMMMAGVVVTALIARELGGGPGAQLIAAGAFAVSPNFLIGGTLLATSTVDPLLWTVVTWLLVRWVRGRDDKVLLWAGAVTAVGIQAKYLIAVLWVVVLVGVLVAGPRELLRRPLLWVGAAIPLVTGLPGLIWQANRGWPGLEMVGVVSQDVARFEGGRVGFVVTLLQNSLPIAAGALLFFGLWRVLRSPGLREYRFLGWAVVLLVALVFALGLRMYHVVGLFGVLWAFGAVEVERTGVSRWFRWIPTMPVFLVSAFLAVFVALPWYPESWVKDDDLLNSGRLGWPTVAGAVALAYHQLPPEQAEHTAIVTSVYWQAGALDTFGPDLGLPAPYSPNRGYYYFGAPPDSATSALLVAPDRTMLDGHFDTVTKVADIEVPIGFPQLNKGLSVYLCEGQVEPWSKIWPGLRTMVA
ncbi:dolichyl-phosphate-mannose-protein mannosyltransferase [Umezawaea tangerina]|uniref:Dolichyl-phosphate-mannose-protein mannosyltransferase n=1 Tax=Umezawaea tangerina TaxID=84725 RepID=A0A2T0SSG5_9PSEU|nr:dolichyl-phosphate-mannose-protein mannosyltransferase [Umezawaea tangerina]